MNSKRIEALLDSDDEYPSTYQEEPELPAYLNDYRFEPIVFKWIENYVSVSQQKRKSLNSDNNRNEYITTGYLSQKDLFCLKAVAKTSSDDTFLWLVDFFVRKDIQSRYGSNLKSCLIVNFPETPEIPIKKQTEEQKLCKKYKIVVKV
ncbi:uncharacterized protein LOC111003834 [Pieris rapae]|uniref:uncharacterized protein LOC111003834 n=1 Tax=Pieris rapae TaxID=64459 RepID=UPI000B92D9CA|nr:uncharacterized protein LOC111003834 [Pieris rapae]